MSFVSFSASVVCLLLPASLVAQTPAILNPAQGLSPAAFDKLYGVARGQAGKAAGDAAREIVKISERLFLAGDHKAARRHANNIWLSSAPHDARQAAWRVLFLVDGPPRTLTKGHRLRIRAPGGRDHRRFAAWLRREYSDKFAWIKAIEVTYHPTLLSPGRAGEDAWITFVLENGGFERKLLTLLGRKGSRFPTDRWKVVREVSLKDAAD